MTLKSPCLALLIRLLLCLPLIVDAFYIDCFNGFIPIKFSSRSSITNTIIFSGPWPHQTECLVSSASAGARTLRSFPRALLPTTSGRNRSLSSSLLNDMIPKTIGVSRHSGMMLSQYWLIRILLLRSLGFVSIFAFLIALHQNKALIGNSGISVSCWNCAGFSLRNNHARTPKRYSSTLLRRFPNPMCEFFELAPIFFSLDSYQISKSMTDIHARMLAKPAFVVTRIKKNGITP